jgi:hypothetical protein
MIIYKRGGCLSCKGGIIKNQKPAGGLAKPPVVGKQVFPTPQGGERVVLTRADQEPLKSSLWTDWFQDQIEGGYENEVRDYPGDEDVPAGKFRISVAPPTMRRTQEEYTFNPMRPRLNIEQQGAPAVPTISPVDPNAPPPPPPKTYGHSMRNVGFKAPKRSRQKSCVQTTRGVVCPEHLRQ